MAMIWINNVATASPSALEVEIEEVGDADTRNALGQRLVDRIAVKRVIELTWAHLTAEQMAALMTATSASAFFTAKYPDPVTGQLRTCVCRVAEQSAKALRVNGQAAEWVDVRMKWEEQ